MLYFKSIFSIVSESDMEMSQHVDLALKEAIEKQVELYSQDRDILNICYQITNDTISIVSRVDLTNLLSTYTTDMLMNSMHKFISLVSNVKELKDCVIVREITSSEFSTLTDVEYSNHKDVLTNQILELFCLDKSGFNYGRRRISSRIVRSAYPNDITNINDEPYFVDFNKELNRVYRNTNTQFLGHPVHYIMNGLNSSDITFTPPFILISQLKDNHRLISSRVLTISLDEIDNKDYLESLYAESIGCTLIFNISNVVDDSDVLHISEFGGTQRFKDILEMCNKYRHKVLTILELASESAELLNIIKENTPDSLTFVELNNRNLSDKKARSYLNKLAKANNVSNRCPIKLEPDKAYTYRELKKLFNCWMDNYLQTNVFPSYLDINKLSISDKKKTIKGKANVTLSKMIGLKEVKDLLTQILSYFKLQKLYKERGIQTAIPCRHMIFSGNPGTAKTTVARLFGEILKDNELLSGGGVIEIGRSDLVEKYVGWTAKNVINKVSDAKGGILFIDEAYSLVDDKGGGFGDEAINALVQEMDKVREHTIIILAGYPDRMEQFMDTNPGIRSRIAFNVNFPNYTEDELVEVFQAMANDKKLLLEKDAITSVKSIVNKNINNKDFGNGRFMRGILEKATMCQSVRITSNDGYFDLADDELLTIKSEDLVYAPIARIKKVGFAI